MHTTAVQDSSSKAQPCKHNVAKCQRGQFMHERVCACVVVLHPHKTHRQRKKQKKKELDSKEKRVNTTGTS